MIEEKTVIIRKQTASEGCWLYRDEADGSRVFTKEAYLGTNAEEWSECTDAEKREWEDAHTPQEPEQVEDAEVVEDPAE